MITVGGLLAAHTYALTLPSELATPLVLVKHVFALVLLGGLFWLAAALGLRLVRVVWADRELSLETMVFALGLGLGGLAYLVLTCGLLGVLHSWVLGLLIGALAVVLRGELREVATAVPSALKAWLALRRELGREPVLRLMLPLTELLVVATAVKALAPPTAFDALMYHLTGPKHFLMAGRVEPVLDHIGPNLPLTVEMLYLLGLAFGSDEVPALIHLSFALLTALGTFALARRLLEPRIAVLAGGIFLSSTAVTVYGATPNIDFGWAFFDFLAVYAFCVWARGNDERWLALAGVAAGLSLGSKYLGVVSCIGIVLGITVEAVRKGGTSARRLFGLLSLFAIPAVAIAAPWYLKP